MSEPRFQITVTDMGGWARVYLKHGEPTGEVARFLSASLTEWMRKCPQLRVKFIVPITSNGDTAELHAWYEQLD
jgi:hypothetical protein